jgi:hypothetical protein
MKGGLDFEVGAWPSGLFDSKTKDNWQGSPSFRFEEPIPFYFAEPEPLAVHLFFQSEEGPGLPSALNESFVPSFWADGSPGVFFYLIGW